MGEDYCKSIGDLENLIIFHLMTHSSILVIRWWKYERVKVVVRSLWNIWEKVNRRNFEALTPKKVFKSFPWT